MALALVVNLATRWHHLHWFQSWPPGNVTCIATLPWKPYWNYQLVLSLYLHQLESHQLSLHKWLSYRQPDPKIGPGTPGSDNEIAKLRICKKLHFGNQSCWPFPVFFGRSVTVHRHQHIANLKVWPTNQPKDQLIGVGSRDVYASKNPFLLISPATN